jgi:hypothetical protein
MNLPFTEKKISQNVFIRNFSSEIDSGELYWHRDGEDRLVESVDETDWMVQLDNQLPIKIEGEIFIPKGVYHRLIKGSNDLQIRLTKLF